MKPGDGMGGSGAGGMDRRAFLAAAGGLAAGLTFPGSPIPFPRMTTRIAAIGLQLYTVRDLMQKDVEGTIAQVAAAGYQEVEFAGYFGKTPAEIKAMVARHNLVAPSAHVPFEAIAKGWDQVLADSVAAGHQYIVVAWIPEEQRKTVDAWKHIGAVLTGAGAAAKKAGLQLAYHNHSYEFVPLEGQRPYDVLLAATDPQLVQLEMDLFWITYGGGDPLAYFAQYPGRVPMVHVKDMMKKPTPTVAPDSVMADVGKGTIDWRRIFARSAQAGIKHYFVEHDSPKDPIASIRASCAYLQTLEF